MENIKIKADRYYSLDYSTELGILRVFWVVIVDIFPGCWRRGRPTIPVISWLSIFLAGWRPILLWRRSGGLDQLEAISLWRGQRLDSSIICGWWGVSRNFVFRWERQGGWQAGWRWRRRRRSRVAVNHLDWGQGS